MAAAQESPIPVTEELSTDSTEQADELATELDEKLDVQSPPLHSDENESAKIIVLQLSFDSSEETVRDYFSAYGEIDKLDLKRYGDGTSRGFAFIIFKSESSLPKVLGEEEHVIDNRKVTVEKARTRSEKMQTNKIFIGKLPSEVTEDHLRDYFSTFGEIDEIQFVYNRQTNERKSFCFIQFKSTEAVEKITDGKIPPESARHTIESYQIECKKKFEDNHPIQRKIKALERQRKGLDFIGYGPPMGPEYYGPPQYGGGGGGYYGGYNNFHHGGYGHYENGGAGGYGYDEYNMYNGYYNGGQKHNGNGGHYRGGRGNKSNYNNNNNNNNAVSNTD